MSDTFCKLRVPDHLVALIRDLHPFLKKRIRAALAEIVANPEGGKPLKEELAGLRSYRTGRYRIIYRLSRKNVEIVAVGPRKHIYEETFLLVSKEH